MPIEEGIIQPVQFADCAAPIVPVRASIRKKGLVISSISAHAKLFHFSGILYSSVYFCTSVGYITS